MIASPWTSPKSPRTPSARSAICARSLCPIEPSARTTGKPIVVERGDEELGELRPCDSRGAGESICEAERRAPHDLVRDRRPLGDAVLADEQPVVVALRDVEELAAADARRDAVRLSPFGERAVGDVPRPRHRRERVGGDLDLRAAARDGDQLVEREVASR